MLYLIFNFYPSLANIQGHSKTCLLMGSCSPGRSLGMGVVAGPEGGRAGGPGRLRTAAPGPGGNPGGTGLGLPGTDLGREDRAEKKVMMSD